MKPTYLILGLTALLLTARLHADTLELADGTLLEGDFVGMSNGIIMWNVAGNIEAFPEAEVVGIYNSEGIATREAAARGAAQTPVQPAVITVPAGTRLVIRLSETVDSRRHTAGHRLRGQLEGALVVNGVTVAPRGTIVHGRVIQAKTGGRAVGSAQMSIEFTDILINDELYEITTTGLRAQTGNEAARTAGRTARAAAIGGLVSGSSGAKTGAKVGLGASILTSGTRINVPAGTLLETTLQAPLDAPG